MRRRRIGIAATLWMTSVGAAILCSSATANADEGEAERLFREGRAAMLEGNFEEGCPKIAESQRLDPHVGTLLNLAACHEKQGKTASAWIEYQKALTAARAEGQHDRARLAEQRIAAVEPRVPWLRISVRGGGPDLSVTLDGGELAPVALGTEMPVDPGPHVVGARASGKRPIEERMDLREGEHRTVPVELAEPLPPLEGPSAPEKIIVEPKPPKKAEESKGRWLAEVGLYLGLLAGNIDDPSPRGSSRDVELTGPRNESSNCGQVTCAYGASDGTSATVGFNGLVGYAISDQVRLGIRGLVGPAFTGGFVGVIGPSLGIRATSAVEIGGWLIVGDADLAGRSAVTPPSGYSLRGASSISDTKQNVGGGAGAGIEASLRLVRLPRGEIFVDTTPFFLIGNSANAFTLPIGMAYRFQ